MSIVLDQQVRNGATDTGSVPIPDGSIQVMVTGTMSDADASVSGVSCRFTALASWDHGLNWSPFDAPYTWSGGVGPKGNFTKPSSGFVLPSDANGAPPTDVKVNYDTLGHAINMGIDLTAF